MTTLSPTEYLYLSRPYWVDGTDMIRTTFQELCLKNILCIEARMLVVDKKETRKRKRYFLKLNTNWGYGQSLSLAEDRLLSIFENKKEWSFSEIRSYVLNNFNHPADAFKYEYVLPDLKRKGYFAFSIILSRKARQEKNYLEEKLELINGKIHWLIQNQTLQSELKEIGPNIILLEKETIEKIKDVNKGALKVGELDFYLHENSFNTLNSISAISSFSDIHSFDFSDGGADFGGGDFGGAGGGSNW
jgi:hypothetical protein